MTNLLRSLNSLYPRGGCAFSSTHGETTPKLKLGPTPSHIPDRIDADPALPNTLPPRPAPARPLRRAQGARIPRRRIQRRHDHGLAPDGFLSPHRGPHPRVAHRLLLDPYLPPRVSPPTVPLPLLTLLPTQHRIPDPPHPPAPPHTRLCADTPLQPPGAHDVLRRARALFGVLVGCRWGGDPGDGRWRGAALREEGDEGGVGGGSRARRGGWGAFGGDGAWGEEGLGLGVLVPARSYLCSDLGC